MAHTPPPVSRPATVAVALLALAVAGCDNRPGTTAPSGKAGVVANAPTRTTTVSAVAERDGTALVELPLGSEDGVDPGQFFRIRKDGRIKGLTQVVEGAGPHRSLARVVAVTDRRDPLAPGDEAVEIRDLAELTDPGRITAATTRASADDRSAAEAQDQAFAALRAQFERELAAQRSAHEQALAELRTVAANERDRLAADQRAAVDRLVIEHQAAVVAAREDQRRASESAWAEERRRLTEGHAAARLEAERLRAQVDGLARQSQDFAIRLAEAQRASESVRSAGDARVRAEVETRQVLAARLQVLQAQLAGRSGTVAPVLATDPGRGEPVLISLERSERERAALAAEAEALRRALDEAQAARLAATSDLAARAEEIAMLRRSVGRGATGAALADRLAEQAAETARLREALAAGELQRLEAERTVLDLATRVLRAGPDGLPALQTLVRERMAAPATETPR